MNPDSRSELNGSGYPEPPSEKDRDSEDELAAVLDAYLAEVEAGRPVDPDEWIRRHPAVATRLRACLRGLHLVEAAAEALAAEGRPARSGESSDETPWGSSSASGFQTGPPDGELADQAETDPFELGGFQVVRELGRGGMGVVYEAIEGALGRRVALKVLPFAAAIDPRQIARFRVEAQAASQLNHPHIVPVYSIGCAGGVHYYAMQLIDGPTLAGVIDWLRDREDSPGSRSSSPTDEATGPVASKAPDADESSSPHLAGRSPATGLVSWSSGAIAARDRDFFREVARLSREAALALEHAHEQGVLHRDVKPSNLLVDGRGHLWVTDFGLARFQGGSDLTAPGDVLGTLRYMSPEQATADHALVDQRTDVYSLGATLYELATLRPIFEGTDRHELLRRIAHEEPRRPRAVRPAVPRDLETIVLKATAKDPAGRYATAQELADDLGRFLDNQPILARRPGLLERSAQLARRHAAALVIAVPLLAATVLALGVAFALVLGEQARTRQANNEARQQRDIARHERDLAREAHADARLKRDKARRAVDRMYTRVADGWLSRQPKLQPVQREFLLMALADYEEFAKESDADSELRAQAGEAALRVGEIQRTLGRANEAERAYRRAIATLEAIPAGTGGVSVLESLGQSYAALGQLLVDSGGAGQARPALERGIELTQRLTQALPATDAGRPRLARAYHRLGLLLRLAGRPEEAEAAYRKTIELAKAMGERGGLQIQAGVRGNLAQLLYLSGQYAEAERAFREAVGLYTTLVERDPEVPLYRRELAWAYDRLGVLADKRPGGRPEAERLIRQGLEHFDRLVAGSPDVPLYREGLALTLLDLANLTAAAGRPLEARPYAERSVALFDELVGPSANGPAELRRQLVWALECLSGLKPAAGQASDAVPILRRAVALRVALAAEGHGAAEDASALARDRSRLGLLLAAQGDVAAARAALEQAALTEPDATATATYLMRAAGLAARDRELDPEVRSRAMHDDSLRARDALRRSTYGGKDPVAPYLLAWFLVAGPVDALRDPAEADRIARSILARAPSSWVAWATLGAARYRADSPRDAVAALEHAAALNHGDLLHYGFFLAMAHHQLDDPDRARACFDRADRRLQGLPRDEEVLRIRAEAAGLLGVEPAGPGPPASEGSSGRQQP